MATYLYKTVLYKANAPVIDPPANNDANRTDFEDNHKSTSEKVNEVLLSETTFVIWISYESFDSLVDGIAITWADIKFVETIYDYELNLLTNSVL